MDPASERPAGIAFGHFQVLPDCRKVLADGRPIKLGDRAFDILIALIGHFSLDEVDDCAFASRICPANVGVVLALKVMAGG